MNKQPAVSVIVPVYKAENYLYRCVDSLLVQTFPDFEILLIDDGSPDRSGKICDEYARKDNRVRVFHKKNGGVSSARQCGIDNAQGEYTIHADPDDWVEPTMLEELYRKAKDDDADMVICDFYEDDKDKTKYVKQQPSALDHETVLRELLFEQLHGSCWNKLVRRDCYSMYNVKFPLNVDCNEDLIVSVKLLLCPLRVSYYPEAYYHYCFNPNSITRHYTIRTYEMRKKFYLKLEEILPAEWKYFLPYYALSIKLEAFSNNMMTKREFQSFAPMSVGDILRFPHFSLIRRVILSLSLLFSFKIGYLLYAKLGSLKRMFAKL